MEQALKTTKIELVLLADVNMILDYEKYHYVRNNHHAEVNNKYLHD